MTVSSQRTPPSLSEARRNPPVQETVNRKGEGSSIAARYTWTESAAAAARIGQSQRRRQAGLDRVGGGGSLDWIKSASAVSRIGQSRRWRQPGFDRVGGGGIQDWKESAVAADRIGHSRPAAAARIGHS